MTIELWSLVGCAAVMFLSIALQGLYTDVTSGLRYVFSTREEDPPRHGPMGGRLDRNVRNQVEGLTMFAPLVLVAAVAGISNNVTEIAAIVTLISRILFVPAYAFGLVPFRTIIWSGSFFAVPAFIFGMIMSVGPSF